MTIVWVSRLTVTTRWNPGTHLNVRVQVNSFEAVCRMVEAGLGIGLVPREAVKLSGRQPLSIIKVEDSWAQRDLKICIRRKTPLSPFAQALIDHLLTE